MDEKRPPEADDDAYTIEDTGATLEELERELNQAEEVPAAAPDGPAESPDEETQQYRDRYLRTLADFDNFRKRSEREKGEFFKYALAGVLKDLLPVLDNFDRALDHAEEGDEFHKGVLMIYKQLFDQLQKHGVKVIDEAGVPFDPNFHEAIVREEDDTLPSHTVSAILQKGYFLHDRLLRPALVKVAVGGPERTA